MILETAGYVWPVVVGVGVVVGLASNALSILERLDRPPAPRRRPSRPRSLEVRARLRVWKVFRGDVSVKRRD